ncbi:TPA: hypothetical protein SFZ51_001886 [Campylobacter jejuni]|nr:hypothetical protein [Campylobacter jejuni]HEG8105014.1 hypothetical protein [Campylobacter jejuni]HEG8134828.1 hypothetical protein [Campylobacter jejuni]
MSDYQLNLLTDQDRERLNLIEDSLKNFETLVKESVRKRDSLNSNLLLIRGKPGIGKTYLTTSWLDDLVSDSVIDKYYRISGKITPVTLYQFLDAPTEFQGKCVHVLDDCDVFYSLESLNILKSASELRSGDKTARRDVCYGARGIVSSYSYKDVIIIITNHDLMAQKNEHVTAVLDRALYLELPITKQDIFVYTTALIEKTLNDGMFSDSTKQYVHLYYEQYLKRFHEYDIFAETGVNFSLRYVLKIIDLFTIFGVNWMNSSIEFKKMNEALNRKLTEGKKK